MPKLFDIHLAITRLRISISTMKRLTEYAADSRVARDSAIWRDERLFCHLGITISSFLGGLPAGFLALAKNYWLIQRPASAAFLVVITIVTFLGWVWINAQILTSFWLRLITIVPFNLISMIAMFVLVELSMGEIYEWHRRNNGQFCMLRASVFLGLIVAFATIFTMAFYRAYSILAG